MMYLAMRYLEVPVIISKDVRADFMEYLANQDLQGLVHLLSQSLEFETERLSNF